MKSLKANSGSIMLLDRQYQVVDSYGLPGVGPSLDNEQVSETVECGLAGWIVANEQLTLVENTLEDPLVEKRPWRRTRGCLVPRWYPASRRGPSCGRAHPGSR
jgi:hypothetical protein